MTKAVEKIIEDTKVLTQVERAELARYLLSSLDAETDEENQHWKNEIVRRINAVDDGTATGRPVEEVIAELKQAYP